MYRRSELVHHHAVFVEVGGEHPGAPGAVHHWVEGLQVAGVHDIVCRDVALHSTLRFDAGYVTRGREVELGMKTRAVDSLICKLEMKKIDVSSAEEHNFRISLNLWKIHLLF